MQKCVNGSEPPCGTNREGSLARALRQMAPSSHMDGIDPPCVDDMHQCNDDNDQQLMTDIIAYDMATPGRFGLGLYCR